MRGDGGGKVLAVLAVLCAAAAWDLAEEETMGQPQLDTDIVPPTVAPRDYLEGEVLEDALGDWLTQFDTYTFMVKQDVDSSFDEENTAGDEDILTDEEGAPGEETSTNEEDDHASFAPISVLLSEDGLLNPHLDYRVLVESLVAEEGFVFITLGKYANKSSCGVGGFSKNSTPNVTESRLDIEHQLEDFNTTIIAFALESKSTFSSLSSSWDEISEDFWWVEGKLVGGGILSLTFTPPVCGCLTLSTYYALPVGNLTLVVGPQAYPAELQKLVCVDPSARYEASEEGDEEADEDHILQDIGHPIVANFMAEDLHGEAEDTEEDEGQDSKDPNQPERTPRPGKLGRRFKGQRGKKTAKRLEKKRRRQERRQRIRQAGRQKVRLQTNQENRANRTLWKNNKKRRQNRKQGRHGKKAWRKFKKQNRKGKRNKFFSRHHNGNTTEEHMEDHHEELNSTQQLIEDERLVDILLGGTSNTSEVDSSFESLLLEGGHDLEENDEAEANDIPGDMVEASPRSRRKNRRQQRKKRRREKKKIYSPGEKFCCKQGVKHKKYIILVNTSVEEGDVSPVSCNSTHDVVTTFAIHQFAIAEDQCEANFLICCSKFTSEMWDAIKAKKTARRVQRKERRKERRQHRKQQRKELRKQRKQERRRHRWQNVQENELEEDYDITVRPSIGTIV
ncbi:glutamic acid-rich protein-like isoform X2 [Homarus americanus]|uniref:glutamic acid-rich protein-like isoform X2 n=1 Tax=Homarus americanus TaxID=6706 RepID=UPI001C470E21|nr:glutamic acid-rich protein-like isoform X2 [Homarus americanus]